MTKLVWGKAKIFRNGIQYAFDDFPQTGSFADIARANKLAGEEIDIEKSKLMNKDEAKKLKNRNVHRELLWMTVRNLRPLNNAAKVDMKFAAEYSKYLAIFLNLARDLALEYSGTIKKGDDFYIFDEPEVTTGIERTGVKLVSINRNGKIIKSLYFWPI
ncbi:hypothetical protein [Polynucleobacter sp.]|jgi:hypothetical protein|uniref:hypothetical protein n=1 Tax=Polynucleobacter sp. TaxID=2029855 RepID=UPI0027356FE7|nr:hypothetical protein [Polynucleobacter sp.]MDP3122394.1 hypothetical protein [Polynucleobacter sp.]